MSLTAGIHPCVCPLPILQQALAIGARAVGIGKAALLGMAAYGQEGVEKTLEILQDEFESTMQFMGTPSIKVSRSASL